MIDSTYRPFGTIATVKGDVLRRQCILRGVDFDQLARLAGLRRETISKAANGHTVSMDTVNRIAAALERLPELPGVAGLLGSVSGHPLRGKRGPYGPRRKPKPNPDQLTLDEEREFALPVEDIVVSATRPALSPAQLLERMRKTTAAEDDSPAAVEGEVRDGTDIATPHLA